MPAQMRAFNPLGLLAIAPAAFGLDYVAIPAEVRAAQPFRAEADGRIAVVDVCGPLTFSGHLFDSYAGILTRARLAFESQAEIVMLWADSPGGDVYGAFDAARALRAMAQASGKRLIAFTASQACSAAYALVSAADQIYLSPAAVLGSVGVINTAVETSAADRAMGVRFTIVTSGARKADGNQHEPMSEEAREAMQATVNAMAGVFFDLVRDHRKIDPAPLQAGIFVGAEAVSKGLADSVSTYEALIASLSKSPDGSSDHAMADKDDNKDPDATRAALAQAAEDKDEAKAARAKRALAAYDDDGDKSAADDAPPPKDDDKDKDKAKSAASDDSGKDKDKPDASAAAASAAVPAVAHLAAEIQTLHATVAQLSAVKAAADRAALRATRPDVPDATFKALDTLPLDQAAAVLATIPKGVGAGAAAPGVISARGTQGSKTPDLSAPRVEDMDPKIAQAMGLIPAGEQFVSDATVHYPSARRAESNAK